jgi:hypothetical protein
MSLSSHLLMLSGFITFMMFIFLPSPSLKCLKHVAFHNRYSTHRNFRTRILRKRAPTLRIRYFFTPGSGMGKKPDPGSRIRINSRIISKSLVQFFGLKILKFFVADPDPGSGGFMTFDPGSGMEKLGSGVEKLCSGIRDPGSATLESRQINSAKFYCLMKDGGSQSAVLSIQIRKEPKLLLLKYRTLNAVPFRKGPSFLPEQPQSSLCTEIASKKFFSQDLSSKDYECSADLKKFSTGS